MKPSLVARLRARLDDPALVGLLGALIVYFALATACVIFIPRFYPPDEPRNVAYAFELWSGRLPQIPDGLPHEAMGTKPASSRRLVLSADSDATGGVHFAVRDYGTGIPPELIERLFEPFVTTKSDGLGLGLSISRTIIAAHGGRLWADNNPDGGATLHCLLPVMEPSRRSAGSATRPALAAASDR